MAGKDYDLRQMRTASRFINCGAGNIPSLGVDGKIYPCARFHNHSRKTIINDISTGDIWNGLDKKEVFQEVRKMTKVNLSEDSCLSCKFINYCFHCVAASYGELGYFGQLTYLCEITKILCKNATKYWAMRETFIDDLLRPEKYSLIAAAKNKYFKRKMDNTVFGKEIIINSDDLIGNYVEVDVPIYNKDICSIADIFKYDVLDSRYKNVMEINFYNRNEADRYSQQEDGPQGNFPIGRWISFTSDNLHEELIITDKIFTSISDIFGKSEYFYEIKNNDFYLYEIT
jgi:radical SAM protein with 4Fe4S-binding SPASM domain